MTEETSQPVEPRFLPVWVIDHDYSGWAAGVRENEFLNVHEHNEKQPSNFNPGGPCVVVLHTRDRVGPWATRLQGLGRERVRTVVVVSTRGSAADRGFPETDLFVLWDGSPDDLKPDSKHGDRDTFLRLLVADPKPG